MNLPVLDTSDAALLENHVVLGKSPGFIGEDVLDLAQFLVQVGCTGHCRGVGGFVVHVHIL